MFSQGEQRLFSPLPLTADCLLPRPQLCPYPHRPGPQKPAELTAPAHPNIPHVPPPPTGSQGQAGKRGMGQHQMHGKDTKRLDALPKSKQKECLRLIQWFIGFWLAVL